MEEILICSDRKLADMNENMVKKVGVKIEKLVIKPYKIDKNKLVMLALRDFRMNNTNFGCNMEVVFGQRICSQPMPTGSNLLGRFVETCDSSLGLRLLDIVKYSWEGVFLDGQQFEVKTIEYIGYQLIQLNKNDIESTIVGIKSDLFNKSGLIINQDILRNMLIPVSEFLSRVHDYVIKY